MKWKHAHDSYIPEEQTITDLVSRVYSVLISEKLGKWSGGVSALYSRSFLQMLIFEE